MSIRNWLTACLGASALLLTGCAATDASAEPAPTKALSAAMSMTPYPSPAAGAAAGPSKAALMICGAEIRQAVARVSAVTTVPSGTSTWTHRLYTCTYRTSGGALVLSVKDSADLASGHRYFTGQRDGLPHARPFPGLLSLGLPSYSTANGTAVFLKDGKTLTVDATGLSRRADQSRADVAYAVAAAVVACWSE